MPHRLRKVRKQRGSRTYGWGQSAGHRGSGSQGGYGKAGRHKHKWTYVLRYQPDYFGKHGFKRSWAPKPKTMNVGELDERIERFLTDGLAKRVGNGIVINLNDVGIEKLLGSGKVTHPLIVTAESWSDAATRKIENAGGQIHSTNIKAS